MRLPILALALLANACAPGLGAATEASAPQCALDGVETPSDAAIKADPSMRLGPGSFCRVVESRSFMAVGERHIVSIADLLERSASSDIEERKGPRVLSVHAGPAGQERLVGRAIIGRDPLDGETLALLEETSPPDDSKLEFVPQLVEIGGRAMLRVTRRNPSLFAIENGRMTAVPAFGWLGDASRMLTADDRAGQALAIDLETMRGFVAVHRAGADDPARPGSAFEASRTLLVDLEWRDGAPGYRSARFVTPAERPKVSQMLSDLETLAAQVKAQAKKLPAGAEPCSFTGWSEDADPRGLNVRAAPAAGARLLGVVPPPGRIRDVDSIWENGLLKSTFDVVGFRDGWFLIEAIEPPGEGEGVANPRSTPKPFKGRGWVNGRFVGGQYANGGLPDDRLYLSPHADAAFITLPGDGLAGGQPPARVLACSAHWALVETRDGARGWFRTLCRNQQSNCG